MVSHEMSIDFLCDAATAVQRARSESKLLMVFLHGDFDGKAVINALPQSITGDRAEQQLCNEVKLDPRLALSGQGADENVHWVLACIH